MSDADDKAGAATGGTTPAQGGNTDKEEAAVIRRPKHIETKPEHGKKSAGSQGNKRG